MKTRVWNLKKHYVRLPRRYKAPLTDTVSAITKISYLIPLFIISCDNQSVEPDISTLGYDYYPIETGQIRTYEVYEILYNVFGTHDTLEYQLRETVETSFIDQAGETNYVLLREVKFKNEANWSIDSTWSTYRTLHFAVLVKNGNPMIPIVFPPNEGVVWDANSLNAKDVDEYMIHNLDSSFTLNGETYPILQVIQEDKADTLFDFIYKIEVFAKGIGLVEKEDNHLVFCQPCPVPRPENGRAYTQKMIEYSENE